MYSFALPQSQLHPHPRVSPCTVAGAGLLSRVDVGDEAGVRQAVAARLHAKATRRAAPVDDDVSLTDVLVYAAQAGHAGITDFLCRLPPHVGVEPGAGNNAAVRVAAARGHTAVVRVLCDLPVERGVQPGAIRNEALVLAATFGHTPVVRLLCELPPERGVDASARNDYATWQAAFHRRLTTVRYLCDHPGPGVDPGRRQCVALEVAASLGYLSIVRMLVTMPLKPGADPYAVHKARCDAVLGAIRGRYLRVVRYLIAEAGGAQVLERVGHAALRSAAVDGSDAIVRYLCSLPPRFHVDPSAMRNEVIRGAAGSGRTAVVRTLCDLPLNRGVDPSALGNEALCAAAQGGHWATVALLCALPLSRGVDVAACHTAMRHAMVLGHLGAVQALQGAITARGGDTFVNDLGALRFAAQCGKVAVVRYVAAELLRMRGGSEPHPVPRNVVLGAVKLGHAAVVRCLVLEVPGGDRWLDDVVKHCGPAWTSGVGAGHRGSHRHAAAATGARDGGASGERGLLYLQLCRMRSRSTRWGCCKSLLLLRALLSQRRAVPLSKVLPAA